jgi:hypothetical protein
MWNSVGPTSADNARGDIASGKGWSVTLMFSVTGDCYEFSSEDSIDIPQVSVCGPRAGRDQAAADRGVLLDIVSRFGVRTRG